MSGNNALHIDRICYLNDTSTDNVPVLDARLNIRHLLVLDLVHGHDGFQSSQRGQRTTTNLQADIASAAGHLAEHIARRHPNAVHASDRCSENVAAFVLAELKECFDNFRANVPEMCADIFVWNRRTWGCER